VRMGRTYSNLMVALDPRNAKLRGRVVRILAEATGLDPRICADAAERAGGDCRTALVSLLADVPVGTAKQALDEAAGGVREALAIAGLGRDSPEGDAR
jgi:N-acetylmuramic acid 6-phosphate etherase